MSKPAMTQPGQRQGFEVFCGVDVARETHHAVALDHHGRRLADRPLPNDEAALRVLFTELARHGQVLVVVDQPASIGALAIAVARSMGIEVLLGGPRADMRLRGWPKEKMAADLPVFRR